ncbi:MAG TPA: hypothetical protein VFS05_09775 [Gemmatimonadaceae bacterium]|nr:hypothetical protein [Gemmatimonadaceae bacterium]
MFPTFAPPRPYDASVVRAFQRRRRQLLVALAVMAAFTYGGVWMWGWSRVFLLIWAAALLALGAVARRAFICPACKMRLRGPIFRQLSCRTCGSPLVPKPAREQGTPHSTTPGQAA